MAAGRYVVVDEAAHKILAGPYNFDPEAQTAPAMGGTLMLASAATADGYTWADPPPLPADAVLRERALQALAVNAAYLAIGTPTAAQVAQQVARLTRQCSGVIRLLLGALDTTDGT